MHTNIDNLLTKKNIWYAATGDNKNGKIKVYEVNIAVNETYRDHIVQINGL